MTQGFPLPGEEISPMYEVEIRSSGNEEEARYSFADQGIYITNISIQNNLLTMDRVQKDGDRYVSASQEYVTNNEERRDTKLRLETYSTESDGAQVRLTFEDGLGDTELLASKADQVADRDPLEIELGKEGVTEKFYVYGMGRLTAVCDSAGEAVPGGRSGCPAWSFLPDSPMSGREGTGIWYILRMPLHLRRRGKRHPLRRASGIWRLMKRSGSISPDIR